MKKEKISKDMAIVKLKALGLSESEAIGTINVRLNALNATRKRQVVDAIIAQIEEDKE